MRLKIKPVQPSPSPEVQYQENHQVTADQEVLKTEAVEEEGQACGWLIPDGNNPMISNSENNKNNPPELSPTTTPVPQYLGKRKRKPKELIDEISPIIVRRKKKQPSVSKSEQAITDGGGKHVSKQEKSADAGSRNPVQVKPATMIRAEEVQSSLGNEYPSFVKLLVRSHVGSCFWMGLPVPFCKTHLPRKDTAVVLEDESGEQFEIKYISEKTGLSAGWRKFVAAHKLVEGDVLIFQLIGPTTFKVLVIRANDLTEVDGALSLLNLDTLAKQSDAIVEGNVDLQNKKKKRPKSLPLTVVQKKKQKAGLSRSILPHLGHLEEQSGNDSDEVASEVLEGSKFSADAVRFRDIKGFEEFRIMVNGVCIDSELPEHVRRKYYELCCSKNVFLHERFLPGLHCKLAAGMIFEAVNTAEAIRACKVTTSRKEFEKWEKSLRSFELLGMNVGFLRARMRRLLSMAFEGEGASEAKRYWEAKNARACTEDEIRNLEAKLVELKATSEKYDAEIEALKSKAESYEILFQEEVNAPW
ncbi:B3 domain-containing protein Os01g0234100-like [Coffea eugenioides]|uniref:B3 domain-containing protein Os01g0234100-like n=1 Tax=Coffea eugenioides TaxID=49369 RepID=UPI000F604640|nr:B3 domain-containing protein Os01g0234100-like [Coffea eugenioides]